jgi:hypothetical protein
MSEMDSKRRRSQRLRSRYSNLPKIFTIIEERVRSQEIYSFRKSDHFSTKTFPSTEGEQFL